MDFENLDSVKSEGFIGFVKIADLRSSDCLAVRDEPGVYLVLRDVESPPKFRRKSTGGYFKDQDPSASLTELRRAWVEGPRVIYIGKAGGPKSKSTLKSRLLLYFKFGQGKSVGHRGGRYIWQLADADELLVCWKPAASPRELEKQLIAEFKARYRCKRPFANLRA